MRKFSKKLPVVLLLVAGMGVAGYFAYKSLKYSKESVPQAIDSRVLSLENTRETDIGAEKSVKYEESITQQAEPVIKEQVFEPALPEELNLKMTFYSQAPFGNWDYPWQEACEEASVLLVANEYFGRDWTAEQFNDEILKLVDWEKKQFGQYEHTTVKETARILNDYLALKALIYEDPSYADVQKILARGHFVIMTFDGKKIGNPFYKNGGPVYHAMVIKGYKSGEKVITADVGTRRGEDYVYSWNTLQSALHDYAVPMSDGAKRIIEVIPPTP